MAGFFFLFIIITNIVSNFLGYKTFGVINSEVQLQKINTSPTKFKVSFVLILIEHLSIIFLAISMFIAFSPYNIILGVIWIVSRIGEALIQIYNKISYWGLYDIAKKYSDTSQTEKDMLTNLGYLILKAKELKFVYAQFLFSIGTFAYSILFVIYGIVPPIIGWFGIIATILYGFGNINFFIKPNFKILGNIGGFMILFFELILGGWLLFFSHL
ncbi:MAG: DUF4386 domain-containing protein [Candidatus Thorarchaeota archaeon]